MNSNKIVFYVDMHDNVKKCVYHESIFGYQRSLIELSNMELRKILHSFLKKYGEPELVEDNDLTVLTFFDIDVDEIDEIIKKSNAYIKEHNHYIHQEDAFTPKYEERKKVIRKNKFNKLFIRTSASLLIALISYNYIKDVRNAAANNKTFPRPSNISQNVDYIPSDDIFLDFSDNSSIFSISDENIEGIVNENENIENSSLIVDNVSESNVTLNNAENQTISYDQILSISAEDWIDTEKYYITSAYYSKTITETAKTYGLDPLLVLAIATHERGLHSEYTDRGGAIGLFQIQVEGSWNWNNKEITAFNFDTQSYETIMITKEDASDIFKNIKIGCMMIQNLLIRNNYNVAKAVTEYNYGCGNLEKVISTCCINNGYRYEYFDEICNLEWLEYRDIISGGDPIYLENVFKYIPSGSILTFNKPDGTVINILYNNSNVKTR